MVKTLHIMYGMFRAEPVLVHTPEDYAASSGELLVFALAVSWCITYFASPQTLHDNELKHRVGYNNLCVGWDVPPAKYVAGSLYGLCVYMESRFLFWDNARDNLDPTLSRKGKTLSHVINMLCLLSWYASFGIFTMDPSYHPGGHTACFVQLVVFRYVSYAANTLGAQPQYQRRGTKLFLIFYGLVSTGFGLGAFIQFLLYDAETKTRGPVPWYLMCALDYCYFACMAVAGYMRPAAPSVKANFQLASDDDYTIATIPPMDQHAQQQTAALDKAA